MQNCYFSKVFIIIGVGVEEIELHTQFKSKSHIIHFICPTMQRFTYKIQSLNYRKT